MADEPFLLKDSFFNRESVEALADAVGSVHDGFNGAGFVDAVLDDQWEARELKARMRWIAEMLRQFLPAEYGEALAILRAASPKTEGFAAMAFSDFVEAFGVSEDIETSLPALEEFTKVVSAEFAVRPFLIAEPHRMLEQMGEWALNDDWRVRRLASEGSRPRLPWGMGLKSLKTDPAPIIPILETLSHDPSEDVRRSVANSLNDISKDHPELVVELLTDWQDDSDEIADITRHALRTLLKQGNDSALGLLGYRPDVEVSVLGLAAEPDPAFIGGKVTTNFSVRNDEPSAEDLMIDGVVGFHRPGGTSTKVFKWKILRLEPGELISIKRSVTLQQLSTRTVHPGTHTIEIQVNGQRTASISFEVVAP